MVKATKSTGVKINEPTSSIPKHSRYFEPRGKAPQSSVKSKGKTPMPFTESKSVKKSAFVRTSERVKASGSAPPTLGKSKQTQKPIFVEESEEEDSNEMTDFTPLQVRFLNSKEKLESKRIEEADFSTEGEDTEAEWEHIFSGHTFSESFTADIPVKELVDSMAIVPYEPREPEPVKEQAPLFLHITLTFPSLTTYL